jgi:serine protease Do
MKNDTEKNEAAFKSEADNTKEKVNAAETPYTKDIETGNQDEKFDNEDTKIPDEQVNSEADISDEINNHKKVSPKDPLEQEQHVNTTRVFDGDDLEESSYGANSDFSYGSDYYRDRVDNYYDGNMKDGENPQQGYGSYGKFSYGYKYEDGNNDRPDMSYGEGYYGENNTGGYGQGTYRKTPPQSKPKKKKGAQGAKPVSRRAFIIGLIICFLLSSLLTFGGLNMFWEFKEKNGKNGPTKKVSATNYTLAEATGSNKSLQEIIAQNEDAVVDIATESKVTDVWLQNYVTKGAGSGVIIQSDGYIMTCNHVIGNAETIKVSTKDGKEYNAKVIGKDSVTDIAVLKIDASNLNVATYGDSSKLQIGDMAVAIGNPLGQLGGSATAGIISSLDRELEVENRVMSLLQTDASVNPGNSGGGLFNGSGNLVGIVVAKSTGSDVEGLGFAIPINTAAEVAKELIENGKVKGRAAIGVSILDLTDAQRAQQYGMRHTGIYVAEVSSDEARKAGFQAGDMIYEFDGHAITTEAVLRKSLAEHKPGDEVDVVVIRGGESIALKTQLVEQ